MKLVFELEIAEGPLPAIQTLEVVSRLSAFLNIHADEVFRQLPLPYLTEKRFTVPVLEEYV